MNPSEADRKMHIKESAFSADGYIINQKMTDNIRFGRSTSGRTGCGWIAVYNLMHALGMEPDAEKIVADLSRTLLPVGNQGLNLFVLMGYLRIKGIHAEYALDSFHASQVIEGSVAGIIMYRSVGTNHYAAYRNLGNGKLRFFGAQYGNDSDIMSYAEFRWERMKFPVSFLISVPENKMKSIIFNQYKGDGK